MFSSTKIMQALSPAGTAAGYQIARSLRFNSADSAYLARTPAGVGTSLTTWTYSCWVKRSALGSNQALLAAGTDASDYFNFELRSDETLKITTGENGTTNDNLVATSAVFRDLSAWYHIVLQWDMTNATSTDRIKIYVNSVRQTLTGTIAAQNYTGTRFNRAFEHCIGRDRAGVGQYSGYMADINFVDGQALTPSSFGETDSATGVWVPKAYTGTYGTNGFWLKFDDNSGTTATTLGKDSSGNGNNWTPNNFSVTAGVGNDSLVDSPTWYGTDTGAGGEVRGNYCTYNPLQVMASTPSFANGNLDVTANAGSWQGAAASLAVTSGKWYWENTIAALAGTGGDAFVGIARSDAVFTTANPQNISGTIVYLRSDGHKRIDGTDTTYGATYTTNDVIGVALDMDASTVTFYKNNVSQGSISFSSSSLAGKAVLPFNIVITSPTQIVSNFGQRPFAYTAPSGFKALCTTNLPTPVIGASASTLANKQFDATLYTGTGSALTVTNAGSFQPDLVWYKDRSAASSNALFDAIRGVDKWLTSNGTDAEATISGVSAFNSNGFSLGTNAGGNFSGRSYVAWQWNAGNSSVSNTSGSITSTVRANQTAGISVVTYTGNGTTGTVGHGLGVAPKLVIVKNRTDASTYWNSYHASIGAGSAVDLNTTAAATASAFYWNNTAPTSSVFTVNTNGSGYTNVNTKNYVAYCFAEVAGFSKFGSYTGNGSADGPFVYCGFRPRFIMIKNSSGVANWTIVDTSRDTYNVANKRLFPSTSDAENTAANNCDILSNGFKIRIGSDTGANTSGSTYIYAAFAESPFNYSRAR